MARVDDQPWSNFEILEFLNETIDQKEYDSQYYRHLKCCIKNQVSLKFSIKAKKYKKANASLFYTISECRDHINRNNGDCWMSKWIIEARWTWNWATMINPWVWLPREY